MANLKLESSEKISVAGKSVNNRKSHNISGINNVYQETIKLNKRPASYTYLYVAEVPAIGYDDKTLYIEAHTNREFTFGASGTGGSTTVYMTDVVSNNVIGSSVLSLSPDLRFSGDIMPAHSATDSSDSHADGADNRVISVTSSQKFVVGDNTTAGAAQITYAYGNQFAISGSMVSGQKYITHTHTPAEDVKVGLRVSGTSIGTNAVVSKIISDTEFEVDVVSTGTATNDIHFSDTIKITFDDDITQANSTKHIAGVSGIFGAEDNLTNRTSVLTSLKKSLDLWVSAGAPFTIGGITNDGTLPYLKITHNAPGPSVIAREIYGSMVEGAQLFSSDRASAAIAQETNTFTNEASIVSTILTLTDTIRSSKNLQRTGGAGSFSNNDVKYIRITNMGSVDAFIFLQVDNQDLKSRLRRTSYTQTDELSSTTDVVTDITCDYNNDPTIAHNANTNIDLGAAVYGLGIPANAFVETVTSDTEFELSASTTGGSVTDGILTFVQPIKERYTATGNIVKNLKPGESLMLYDALIDTLASSSNAPLLTEIDYIKATSESATTNGSLEVFIASK